MGKKKRDQKKENTKTVKKKPSYLRRSSTAANHQQPLSSPPSTTNSNTKYSEKQNQHQIKKIKNRTQEIQKITNPQSPEKFKKKTKKTNKTNSPSPTPLQPSLHHYNHRITKSVANRTSKTTLQTSNLFSLTFVFSSYHHEPTITPKQTTVNHRALRNSTGNGTEQQPLFLPSILRRLPFSLSDLLFFFSSHPSLCYSLSGIHSLSLKAWLRSS